MKRNHDARHTEAILSTNKLACLTEMADERGIDCRRWFWGLGLSREQVRDANVRVSFRQARLVLKRAMKSLALANLGLEIGKRQTIGNFGVLGLAMMTARTFGDALAISMENHIVTGSLMDIEFEPVSADEVAIIARPRSHDPDILPFLCEELFLSSLILSRNLVGAQFRPLRLELSYPAPEYAAQYASLFQCEVRFGQRDNRAAIATHWLSTPLPNFNPISAQLALALCRQQSAASRHSEIVDSVERLLRRRLQDNPPLSEIAGELNLTERTLRRQLTAAGVGFKQLHDRVRAEQPRSLLGSSERTIAEIGSAVGFRDVREFRRAFKRWTGMPPRAMRVAGG